MVPESLSQPSCIRGETTSPSSTRRPMFGHLLLFTALLAFSSCAQEPHEAQSSVRTPCRAPAMPQAIEDALCSGSSTNLRTAIFNDSSAPDTAFLMAFQRVFDGDLSYGQELPWDALRTERMRATIAEYLAQAIRNSDYEGSLASFEKFAIQFAQGATSNSDQLDGIRLLGIVDAQSQIPVLRATALSQHGSPTRRAYAIDALGRICAPEAAAALDEIEREVLPASIEAKHLATARSDRGRLQNSWCRKASPLPSSASGSPKR